jgi:hypothetical protein
MFLAQRLFIHVDYWICSHASGKNKYRISGRKSLPVCNRQLKWSCIHLVTSKKAFHICLRIDEYRKLLNCKWAFRNGCFLFWEVDSVLINASYVLWARNWIGGTLQIVCEVRAN